MSGSGGMHSSTLSKVIGRQRNIILMQASGHYIRRAQIRRRGEGSSRMAHPYLPPKPTGMAGTRAMYYTVISISAHRAQWSALCSRTTSALWIFLLQLPRRTHPCLQSQDYQGINPRLTAVGGGWLILPPLVFPRFLLELQTDLRQTFSTLPAINLAHFVKKKTC